MLRRDLVELMNSGRAWAFIGSGPSVEAGCPSWKNLAEIGLQTALAQKLAISDKAQRAIDNNELPRAFRHIERALDRDRLEAIITSNLGNQHCPPGPLHRIIASWPFAAYITSNYDHLLEAAISETGDASWVSIGNSEAECRKVSGDANRIVWHAHGSAVMPPEQSRLIVTEADYDSLYLYDSPASLHLKAAATQHQIVFLGFGFQDPDVNRILRYVGHLSNPAKPAYAFLPNVSTDDAQELLERYNVEVITYRTHDGSHHELQELLKFYGSFFVKRGQHFGQDRRVSASYDTETTGLLIYNNITLSKPEIVQGQVIDSLLTARILSTMHIRGTLSKSEMIADIGSRTKPLDKDSRATTAQNIPIEAVLDTLSRQGLIKTTSCDGYTLTDEGRDLVSRQQARAELLRSQFCGSVAQRAEDKLPDQPCAARRVSEAAAQFLTSTARERGLGVALSWGQARQDFRDYHIVALLQNLPGFMSSLSDEIEAKALSSVVQDFLARPTESEKKYIGLVIQSHFGLNILGFGSGLISARSRDIAETAFIIDASTLIHAFARHSSGNSSAITLLNRLRTLGSPMTTTDLLLIEVAEHANYADRQLDSKSSTYTLDALQLALGRNGQQSNVFIEGFLSELARGEIGFDFRSYMRSIGTHWPGSQIEPTSFHITAQKLGVEPRNATAYDGFDQNLHAEMDELQDEIAEWRKERKSFKHERQVKAEAEALLIVESIRRQKFKIDGKSLRDAYFISNSGVIDRVSSVDRPITLRSEAVLQWVSTLIPATDEEVAAFTESLLWELSERGCAVVDEARLQTIFSPLINASQERLREELERQRPLIASLYGEDSVSAFEQVREVEIPTILNIYMEQKAKELERRLEAERTARIAAESRAKVSAEDLEELARLRSERSINSKRARRKDKSHTPKRRKKRRRDNT